LSGGGPGTLRPGRGFGHQRGSRSARSNPMSFGKYLKDVKAQIREVDLETVRKTVEARKGKSGDGNGAGPILIDVREKDEWTEGFIPGAQWIPRGFLELGIEDTVPEKCEE